MRRSTQPGVGGRVDKGGGVAQSGRSGAVSDEMLAMSSSEGMLVGCARYLG